MLLARLRHWRRINCIVCTTASLFLRLPASSIVCVLIMAIVLLGILANGVGSLSLLLVLEMIAHCRRVVTLCLRWVSISATAKHRLLINRLLLGCSNKLLVLDGLHLLEGLQILVSLQALQFLIYWIVLSLNLSIIF